MKRFSAPVGGSVVVVVDVGECGRGRRRALDVVVGEVVPPIPHADRSIPPRQRAEGERRDRLPDAAAPASCPRGAWDLMASPRTAPRELAMPIER